MERPLIANHEVSEAVPCGGFTPCDDVVGVVAWFVRTGKSKRAVRSYAHGSRPLYGPVGMMDSTGKTEPVPERDHWDR